LPPIISPCVGEGDSDGVVDAAGAVEPATTGELELETDLDADSDTDDDTDTVRDDDAPSDLEAVGVGVTGGDTEIVDVLEGDVPTDNEAVRVTDDAFVTEGVTEIVLEAVGLLEAIAAGVTLTSSLADLDGDLDTLGEEPLEGDRELLVDLLGDREMLGVFDGVRDPLTVEPFDIDGDGDGSLLGVRLPVLVFVDVLVLLSDPDAVAPLVGVRVAVPVDIFDVFWITNVSSTSPRSFTNVPVSLSPDTSTMKEPASVNPFRPFLPRGTFAGCFNPSGDVSTCPLDPAIMLTVPW
jgi:hypothetical protein